MEDIEEAKALLARQRYKDAAAVLDRMLTSFESSDELWYLRGILSLKLKNYDAAQECFERALILGRKSKYFQIKGMAYFEMFEIEEAVRAFSEALAIEPDNPTTLFFLAVCYMFLDDPRSDDFIGKAFTLDQKKTRQLLLNFYSLFIKDDPRVSDALKKKMEDELRKAK